jgi:hypothetical protein
MYTKSTRESSVTGLPRGVRRLSYNPSERSEPATALGALTTTLPVGPGRSEPVLLEAPAGVSLMAWFDFELREGSSGQAHWAAAVVIATVCTAVATVLVTQTHRGREGGGGIFERCAWGCHVSPN